MIGYFEDLKFICSSEKFYTPSNWNRELSARWNENELLNRKPMSNYKGPGLERVSFKLQLSSSLGVDIQEELRNWREYLDEGKVGRLALGEKISENLFRIDSLKESNGHFDKDGNYKFVELEVTMTEYALDEGDEEEPVNNDDYDEVP